VIDNTILKVQDLRALSIDRLQELQYKIQTDLWFLANNVCRNADDPPLIPEVHGGIINTLLHPDPRLPIEAWSDKKLRVLLSYRGSQKSTINAVSLAQQILCNPQIRILVLSGKLSLAQTILKTTRAHFLYNEVLDFLFPDFCREIDIKVDEFDCPLHDPQRNEREKTLQVGTFGSVKVGLHTHHVVLDDASSEANQRTADLVEKSIRDFDDLRFLKLPNAYTTFIGTRWALNDIPTVCRQRAEQEEKKTGVNPIIFFQQPVWTLKKCTNEDQQKAVDELESKGRLTAKEVDIPNTNLNLDEIFQSYRDDRKGFYSQMLMMPEAVSAKIFPRHLLQRQVRGIQAEPPPHRSSFFVNCDLAGLSGKSDFSCLIGGYFNLVNGQLFVRKMILERFERTFDLITAILHFYQEFDGELGGFRIENSTVTSFLREPLEERAKTMQWLSAFNILWESPERIPNAKAERIFGLKNAIANDKIHFWEGLDNLEELFRQLESFDGKKCVGKDDAADCLAQLWQRFSKSVFLPAILPMQPSAPPVIWTNSDTSVEASLPDANELSAAQDAVRYTMPTLI
jgi:hypothetical protein